MSVRDTVAILEALVGFDTTSRNSNLALIGWVENYLDRFGVVHERVLDATGAKANLWATGMVARSLPPGGTRRAPLRPRRSRHERLPRLLPRRRA
jgi:hypothetical protein